MLLTSICSIEGASVPDGESFIAEITFPFVWIYLSVKKFLGASCALE